MFDSSFLSFLLLVNAGTLALRQPVVCTNNDYGTLEANVIEDFFRLTSSFCCPCLMTTLKSLEVLVDVRCGGTDLHLFRNESVPVHSKTNAQ
jgi:hypothetical protein